MVNKIMDLLNELDNFTGTACYYKSTFGKLRLTEGMNYLRNEANCFWLIDIIESVQHLKRIQINKDFVIWKIEVKDKAFKVTAWADTPYKSEMLYSQEGEYTNFPLEELEFYQEGDVLLLKSEQ